jgi:hypothetical protein
MKAEVLLARIKADITDLVTDKVVSIPPSRLLIYLQSMESDIKDRQEFDVAKVEWDRQQLQIGVEESKQYREHLHQSSLETFRSVITAGQGALKAGLLINGCGAAALLAFLGHLVTAGRGVASLIPPVANGLAFMTSGMLLCALAAGSTYAAQHEYGSDRERVGHGLTVLAVALFLASITCFGLGAAEARSAFPG